MVKETLSLTMPVHKDEGEEGKRRQKQAKKYVEDSNSDGKKRNPILNSGNS